MLIAKFEWKEDQELGGEGWIPTRFPNFSAGEGLTIAHDTLEHFANDEGNLAGELRAFGAMIFTRVEGGYFSNEMTRRSAEENLGMELGRFLEELGNGEHSGWGDFPRPPRTYRLKNGTEEIIDKILTESLKSYQAEMQNYSEDHLTDSYQTDIELSKMHGWLRIGYRKAVRRFRGAGSGDMSYLFGELKDRIDEKHKNGSYGEVLTVSVNIRRLTFEVSQNYPNEDEYQDM
jgi:hypothetical protein